MKKRLIILIFSVGIIFSSKGQDTYCGTDYSPEDYRNFKKESGISVHTGKTTTNYPIYYIPVKFHLVGNDDGTLRSSRRTALNILCELNTDYQSVSFHFYLHGSIDYINNTTYNTINQAGMFNANVNNAVNVYIVEDALSNGNTVCGYFTYSGDAVVMSTSCAMSGDKTFPHEMGHYFFLPHTFSGWEHGNIPNNKEYVNGSNCSTAGDEFCDTDADYLYWRWNCPYTGNIKDPLGVTIHPDETLFMSYANDNCVNRFSAEQRTAMQQGVYYYRNELINNHPTPNISQPEVVTLLNPASLEEDVPVNYIVFKWRKDPLATSYHLIASRFNIYSDTKLAIDVITSDTFYIAINEEFEIYKTYKWMVKPYTPGYTCVDYSPYNRFITGKSIILPTGINELNHLGQIVITPNPVIANTNVHFSLTSNKNFEANATIFDVSGKIIYNKGLTINAGNSFYTLTPDNLTTGIYLLQLQSNTDFYRVRFIVTD